MKTKDLVLISILTALATIIMFIEIPNPIAPFLKLDLSDVVVLVAFAIYGWKGAGLVGVLKALIHALIKGPDMYSAIPYLGTFVAIFASLTIVLAFCVSTNRLKLNKIITFGVVVSTLTVVLTVVNYYIVTPAYFGWPTVSLAEVKGMFTGFLNWDTGGTFDPTKGYLMAVLFAYVPFNIIKGSIIMGIYYTVERSLANKLKELR
ncbi:Gx transporter family protein [Mycoplasmatota bacterium WC44]